jgi:hypothetical protein
MAQEPLHPLSTAPRTLRLSAFEVSPAVWLATVGIAVLALSASALSASTAWAEGGVRHWLIAAVGVPLGLAVAWLWVRALVRAPLLLLWPAELRFEGGQTTVRVRSDDGWRRSAMTFVATGVSTSKAQGPFTHLWLTHASGAACLVATVHDSRLEVTLRSLAG